MFFIIRIAYKTRGYNSVRGECVIAQTHPGKYEVSDEFNFIWMLSKSELVKQFTVTSSLGYRLSPKEFGWGEIEKWVTELTYIHDGED